MNEIESKEFEVKKTLEKDRENIGSLEELMSYLENVKENYNCGYGEAPRAIAQASLATAWYLAKEFGITGFQAGFVMWDFIRGWMYQNNECGMKIINYDDMLYPQCDYKFEKYISRDTFETLKNVAQAKLDEDYGHPLVREHWQSIVDGNIPFGYVINDEH